MSNDPAPSTATPPGTDLSDRVTVFVTTVGAPGFEACLQHVERQDVRFETRIIDHVAPMNAAFQKMVDDCTTPYYVQVDEDMLLRPNAVRWLYDRMTESEPDVAIVVAYLLDTHLGFPVQGIKMFRHEIVRNFPFAAAEACELDHNGRLMAAGYRLRIFRPEEVADSEDGTMGLHGTHWSPRAVYERYATLQRKYRRFPDRLRPVGDWPRMILQRFLDEGSETDLFALLGVIAGRLEALDGTGAEKDYRTYENLAGFDQAEAFVEAFAAARATPSPDR